MEDPRMERVNESRCVMNMAPSASSPKEEATTRYVCGIDIGSQSCSGCICRPDKSVVVRPITFANIQGGWQVLEEKLTQLDACIGYLAHPFEKWITCRCKYARSDLLSPQDMPFKQRKKFDGEAELSSPRHLLQKHAMIRAKPGEDCLVPLPAISQRVFQASRSSSVVVV